MWVRKVRSLSLRERSSDFRSEHLNDNTKLFGTVAEWNRSIFEIDIYYSRIVILTIYSNSR